MSLQVNLPVGKKIYFASDFHLCVPNAESSLKREKLIVNWFDSIKSDAHAIYLVGDIFDFWFEYKHAIPKGFIRFQGKLAELKDSGISIFFFTGNHDMWMFDYFTLELDIPVYRSPIEFRINNVEFLVGHGDGLGPGDNLYKVQKRFFNSKACQWLFARIHPNLGIGIANYWSKQSRISNNKREEKFRGDENEFLLTYCKEQEKIIHHDYYVFGHRHLPLDLKVSETSRYINLGEWVHFNTYAEFDGQQVKLKTFPGN